MSENKFQVGDRIRVVSDHEAWLCQDLNLDTIFTAVEENGNAYFSFCPATNEADLHILNAWPNDFELVERQHTLALDDSKEVIIPIVWDKADPLGIHRPALEDRKVGKVGMHMVIDGFPRALREVARVMTWAEQVKGYKLHDWVNLPNAEIEFPAAEYRHQNDNSIMKSEGTPAIERTDHESNLLHAAHKVFNSLAELELILQGKIK